MTRGALAPAVLRRRRHRRHRIDVRFPKSRGCARRKRRDRNVVMLRKPLEKDLVQKVPYYNYSYSATARPLLFTVTINFAALSRKTEEEKAILSCTRHPSRRPFVRSEGGSESLG